MAGNKIVTSSEIFNHKKVLSGTIKSQIALPGDNLTIDVLNATLDGAKDFGTRFIPKGSTGLLTAEKKSFYVSPVVKIFASDISGYAYGEEVTYYHNDKLVGKYYMSSVRRVNKFKFEISCISAVGLLDNATHYGGIYEGTPMSHVLADIIGGMVPHTLDTRFQNLPVYGWLPIASRKENLQQLLFAEGASMRKDLHGNLFFTAITNENPSEISNNRLSSNGAISVSSQATRADVTEHSYLKRDTDQDVTLFDGNVSPSSIVTPNGNVVEGLLVTFSDPAHTLSVTDGAILESGVNYAVLGQGSSVNLTGKKYTHTSMVITKQNLPKKLRGLVDASDNIITVKNATLISIANSENVADRMIAYYGSVKEVSVGVVVGSERPGDPITFEDPFGDRNAGFISRMDIRMSNTLKAASTLISGYVPPNIGNNYTKFVVLTGNGVFTAPDGVKSVRVVVIGAGSGGGAGRSGGSGGSTSLTIQKHELEAGGSWSAPNGYGGKGGVKGKGASGGKVYQKTISVSEGEQFSYAASNGGAGSAVGGLLGNVGGDSTFGTLTSADGSSSQSGYANPLNGMIYAQMGSDGTPGGDGGDGSGASSEEAESGSSGKPVGSNMGGRGGVPYNYENAMFKTIRRSGGAGGGGASNLSAGASGSMSSDGNTNWAGRGANATYVASPKNYGAGGNGGNGGGGGSFSVGSDGSDGCIIVFY